MVRKRRPIVLVLGLLFLVGGIVAGTIGVLDIIDAVSIPDDEVAVRGRTGEQMDFSREASDPERWTIYLDSTSSNSDIVDSETASTRCEISLSDGSSASVNGARQVSSVNLNGQASIGYFDAPVGPVAVRCDSSSGTFRVFVAEGGPRLGLSQFGLIFGGVGALVLGIILTIIGARRRWVAVPAL